MKTNKSFILTAKNKKNKPLRKWPIETTAGFYADRVTDASCIIQKENLATYEGRLSVLLSQWSILLKNQEHRSENPKKPCLHFMLSLSRIIPNAFSSLVTTANQKPISRLTKMKEFTFSRAVKQAVQSLIFHDPGLKSTK